MCGGEELADRREETDVGGRIRARRTADWALVNLNHLVDLVEARDPIVRPWSLFRAVQPARERLLQDVGDEGALAAPRDARHGNEFAEREGDVDLAQVVLPRPLDRDRLATPLAARLRHRHRAVTTKVGASNGVLRCKELLERAVRNQATAMFASAGSNIYDPVGGTNRLFVMLNHQHRIAEVAQPN